MTVGWSRSSFVVPPLFTDWDDMNTVHLKYWNSYDFLISFEPPRGKTNNVVSEQVRHKSGCTVTEKS